MPFYGRERSTGAKYYCLTLYIRTTDVFFCEFLPRIMSVSRLHNSVSL